MFCCVTSLFLLFFFRLLRRKMQKRNTEKSVLPQPPNLYYQTQKITLSLIIKLSFSSLPFSLLWALRTALTFTFNTSSWPVVSSNFCLSNRKKSLFFFGSIFFEENYYKDLRKFRGQGSGSGLICEKTINFVTKKKKKRSIAKRFKVHSFKVVWSLKRRKINSLLDENIAKHEMKNKRKWSRYFYFL